jgi:hypothetical protein
VVDKHPKQAGGGLLGGGIIGVGIGGLGTVGRRAALRSPAGVVSDRADRSVRAGSGSDPQKGAVVKLVARLDSELGWFDWKLYT